MYINRDIERVLLDAAESFQVITIYGSRQVGKSTTVNHLFCYTLFGFTHTIKEKTYQV